jgi:hypothetical protein
MISFFIEKNHILIDNGTHLQDLLCNIHINYCIKYEVEVDYRIQLLNDIF